MGQNGCLQRIRGTDRRLHRAKVQRPCRGYGHLFSMCILEEMQWKRTKSITSSEFFHGTLELVEKNMPVFLVKSAGPTRKIDDRAEAFLKEHTDELVVVDVLDYMIPDMDKKFAPLVAPIISTALLNGRLSKHFEIKQVMILASVVIIDSLNIRK